MSEDILARHERDGDISYSEAEYFCKFLSVMLGQKHFPHLQGTHHTEAVSLLTPNQLMRYWARYKDIPKRIRTVLENGEIVVKENKVMCTICDVPLSKKRTVNDHLSSSNHVTKVASRNDHLPQESSPQPFRPRRAPQLPFTSPLVFDESGLNQEAPSTIVERTDSIVTHALRNGHIKTAQEVGIVGFKCNVCGSPRVIRDYALMQQHLLGETHLKNDRRHKLRQQQPSGAVALPQPLSPPSRDVGGTRSRSVQVGHQDQETKTEALPSKPVTFYKNDSTPRGIVVIFNYIFKKDPEKLRKGASKDHKNLRAVFMKMGYNVWETNVDKTRQETLDKLDEVRSSSTLSKVDSLIIVFLSHGGTSVNDEFFTSDDKTISVNEILYTKFTDQKCPLMKDKPKLFIFNYCRGQITPSNPIQFDNWRPHTHQLEAPSDVAVIQATLPDFKAGRYIGTGTIFVKEFCKVLERNSRNMELPDIIYETSRQMKKDIKGNTPTVTPIHFRKFKFT